jgi:hypothetical protein
MTRAIFPAVLLALFLSTSPLEAQRRQPGPVETPPITLGAKAGFDTRFDKPMAGLVVKAPVPVQLPGRGFLAVQAAADFTFLDALTERQLTLDVLYDLGGLSIGGGPVFRNSFWVDSPVGERETRSGYSIVVGLGGMPMARSAIAVGLEYRFVSVEELRPRPLTLTVAVAPSRLFGGR